MPAGTGNRSIWPLIRPRNALDPVDELSMALWHEVTSALGANGEEVGVALEQPLHHAGHVRAAAAPMAPVELLLGEGRQSRQLAGDRPGLLVQGEHGLQFVFDPVAERLSAVNWNVTVVRPRRRGE